MPGLLDMLETRLEGRVCLIGVGNTDYGDDGVGILLARTLQARHVPDVVVAGNGPERWHCSANKGFAHVVFLDAVDCGLTPGSVVFLDSTEMAAKFPQVSTHKIALGTLARFAEANGHTKVWLLGVQPESLQGIGQLTPAVQKTLDMLTDMLCRFARAGSGRQPHAEVNV